MKTGEEVRGTSDGGAHGREVRKVEPQPGCGRGLARAEAVRAGWTEQRQELCGRDSSRSRRACLVRLWVPGV